MRRLWKIALIGLIGLAWGWAGHDAWAAELKPGTIISAQNLDTIKGDTFERHTIASLLTERLEWQVRTQGLKIKLRHSEELPMDPRYVEATKKYAKDVKYDPKTRLVTGYKAGLPFPNLDTNDPNLGDKLIWNYHWGAPSGTVQDIPKFYFLLIDGRKGLERAQTWFYLRYYFKGRLTGNPIEGDGSIYTKTLIFATHPRDIRGLGTFTIAYDTGKVDDNWAYIKTVRRTRRLSGGAWMDPIGGLDQLNDDVEVFNAFPTWYPKYKVLGKRWVLAVAHSEQPTVDVSKEGTPEEYARVDLKTPPYWNLMDSWEPREVWVIEATTPPEHPYSKKVLYMDTKFPRFYFSETYDRKGEFWKFINFTLRPMKTEEGGNVVESAVGQTIDFQRRHATIFLIHPSFKINTPGVTPDKVTLGVLEAAGQGK